MLLEEVYNVKKVQLPHDINVCVPGSKSITNRALLLAALGKGSTELQGVLFSDDSRHFLQALVDLGYSITIDENNKKVVIEGCDGKIPCVNVDKPSDAIDATVYVGSAGTAARFLTAFLGLSKGRFHMTSSEQMQKRPMKELLLALEELGANISYEKEKYHFPFIIENQGIEKNEVTIDIDKSSQFLSALLISSVLFEREFKIYITGTHGMAYVNMTYKMMQQFGLEAVERINNGFIIHSNDGYTGRVYQIEPDMSAACYFYAMSPILSVNTLVKGVHSNSLQGDIQFLSVLEEMGCEKIEQEDGIVIKPPKSGLKGGEWNLSSFSDQALTLAAIAPFAKGDVHINQIEHIKFQECDRIHAILVNLRNMGVVCSETEHGIVITPGTILPCEIETFEDHRVAMAFAISGLSTGGIQIKNPACCRKTFENYFEVLEQAVY